MSAQLARDVGFTRVAMLVQQTEGTESPANVFKDVWENKIGGEIIADVRFAPGSDSYQAEVQPGLTHGRRAAHRRRLLHRPRGHRTRRQPQPLDHERRRSSRGGAAVALCGMRASSCIDWQRTRPSAVQPVAIAPHACPACTESVTPKSPDGTTSRYQRAVLAGVPPKSPPATDNPARPDPTETPRSGTRRTVSSSGTRVTGWLR